jgi:hypothetical protein
MLKVIKWSSFADIDLANLLEYLEINWNYKVCNDFLDNLDHCILQIQKIQTNLCFLTKNCKSENVLLPNTIRFFIVKPKFELKFYACMIAGTILML